MDLFDRIMFVFSSILFGLAHLVLTKCAWNSKMIGYLSKLTFIQIFSESICVALCHSGKHAHTSSNMRNKSCINKPEFVFFFFFFFQFIWNVWAETWAGGRRSFGVLTFRRHHRDQYREIHIRMNAIEFNSARCFICFTFAFELETGGDKYPRWRRKCAETKSIRLFGRRNIIMRN